MNMNEWPSFCGRSESGLLGWRILGPSLVAIALMCRGMKPIETTETQSAQIEIESLRRDYVKSLHDVYQLSRPNSKAARMIDSTSTLGLEVTEEKGTELKYLYLGNDLAVCRTPTALYGFSKDESGRWRVSFHERIPSDWITQADVGFSTHVSGDSIRRVLDDAVAARMRDDTAKLKTLISTKSSLHDNTVDTGQLLFVKEVRSRFHVWPKLEDSFEIKSLELLFTEGRYTAGRLAGRFTKFEPVRSSNLDFKYYDDDSIVLFRTDNGVDWKLLSVLAIHSSVHDSYGNECK